MILERMVGKISLKEKWSLCYFCSQVEKLQKKIWLQDTRIIFGMPCLRNCHVSFKHVEGGCESNKRGADTINI